MYELKRFKDIHNEDKCLILSLGPSLLTVNLASINCYTIGVNDIEKLYLPNYLVVTEKETIKKNFPKDSPEDKKNKIILASKADYIFSVHELPFQSERIVRIPERRFKENLNKIYNENGLFRLRKSSTTALSLALYMGFSQIGIIGFDLRGDRAMFNETNNVSMKPEWFSEMNQFMKKVYEWGLSRNQEIYNLSEISLINAFPKMNYQDFMND